MDEELVSSLVVTERLLTGFEPETLKRTLSYQGEALADVYVDRHTTDCTIAWPVITGIDLATLFDGYHQFAGDLKTTVEWRMGNEFFETKLSGHEAIQSTAKQLREQELKMGSRLDLVQLVCDKLVFEVTFGVLPAPAPATRLAVVVSPLVTERLPKLFSRYHKNQFVRAREEIAYIAFIEPRGQGFQMLCTAN